MPETISYIKILTVGHQVPDNNTIFQFKCAVKEFLKKNKNNDKLIGVHCTHGLNRTGYLICRYLIDVEGMRPDDAIECKYEGCHYFSLPIKVKGENGRATFQFLEKIMYMMQYKMPERK